MAKVKVQYTGEDVEKVDQFGDDFTPIPSGYYHLRVVEANAGYSKGENDEPDESRPRIEMVYEVEAEGIDGSKEPAGNYGRIWDYLTFGEKAGRNRAMYAKAFYPDEFEEGGGEIEFDTDDLVEQVVLARVTTKKEKDRRDPNAEARERTRIRKLMALGDAPEGDGEVDTSDAFAPSEPEGEEASDPFAEEEAEPEGDGLLTEAELEPMELKELGAIAKEFDLDPKDSIVKFKSGAKKDQVNTAKTKEAVIAAILEAQGSNDDGDEPDTSGDPF